MDETRRKIGDVINYASTNYEALNEADALTIVTDWNEYRHPDFGRIKASLRRPIVIDGRNLYSAAKMKSLGFTYASVGQTTRKGPDHAAADSRFTVVRSVLADGHAVVGLDNFITACRRRLKASIACSHRGRLPADEYRHPNEFTVRELAEIFLKLTGSSSHHELRPLPVDDPKCGRPDISRAREHLQWNRKSTSSRSRERLSGPGKVVRV